MAGPALALLELLEQDYFDNTLCIDADRNIKKAIDLRSGQVYFVQSKEHIGRVDFPQETFDLIVNIFPSLEINSTSLVSGSFLTISYIICAFNVVEPSSITLQIISSLIEISISVEDNVNELFAASIKILESIGSVFFLLTILCR